MRTNESQRAAFSAIFRRSPDLDGASVLVVTINEAGELLLSVPPRLEWIDLGAFVERCASDGDNGKARLLSIWPDCPPAWSEKILAAINVGPMLLGASA